MTATLKSSRPRTMFTVPKGQLLVSLKLIGASRCQYAGGEWIDRRCDCKFLVKGATRLGGEATGCPEIRQVVHMLERDELANSEKLQRLGQAVRGLYNGIGEAVARLDSTRAAQDEALSIALDSPIDIGPFPHE